MQRLPSVVPAHVRGLATAVSRAPLSGLNATARPKAEQITAQWKGTNASGENVKNYIGGKFIDSKTDKWIDLVDPVRPHRPSCRRELMLVTTVNTNLALSCPRNDTLRVRAGRRSCQGGIQDLESHLCSDTATIRYRVWLPTLPLLRSYRLCHYVLDFRLKYVKMRMPSRTASFLSKERLLLVCHFPTDRVPIYLPYSYTDAHGDILRGLQVVETACNIPTALMGNKIEVAKDMDTETRRLPLGVCARSVSRLGRVHRGWSLTNLQHLSVQFPCVSPAYICLPVTSDCNLRMIPLWTIPLATVTGNTLILKPSERDPGAAMMIAELCERAGMSQVTSCTKLADSFIGLPPGVLNIVHGSVATVNSICDHPDIKAVSFVGGDKAGKHIYQRSESPKSFFRMSVD